jgi:hypothetical protein
MLWDGKGAGAVNLRGAWEVGMNGNFAVTPSPASPVGSLICKLDVCKLAKPPRWRPLFSRQFDARGRASRTDTNVVATKHGVSLLHGVPLLHLHCRIESCRAT